jgi:hypothetical protein
MCKSSQSDVKEKDA